MASMYNAGPNYSYLFKYWNYEVQLFFIEIGIYWSSFETQYIYPAKIFFYLANIIIDQAFNVWALVQETTGSILCVCPPVLPGSTG